MYIFADFNNRDRDGRLRLNNVGTTSDLSLNSITLSDGLRLMVSDGDLAAEIIVRTPGRENVWLGEIVGDIIDLDQEG